MEPLRYAAAASRLAGLLDASAPAGPRADPPQLGIRALLSAIAPYVATTSLFVVDVAAANRAATSSRAALVRDLLAPRLSLLAVDASAGPRGHLLPVLAATTSMFVVDAAAASRAASSSHAALVGDLLAPCPPLLHAAVVRLNDASTLIDASAGPGHLLPALAATKMGLLVGGAAAAASCAPEVAGIVAPPRLFLSTPAASIDPTAPCGIMAVLDTTADVSNCTSMALAPRFAAWTRIVSRHAGTPVSLHPAALFSTTTPEQPVAGARIFRQLNNSMKRELTRLRHEVGATRARQEVSAVDSLDVMLRDMGYFTRGPFARLFGLFTVLTIMSEGVREFKIRFGQLAVALRSLREKGEVKEGIMGENFSWLFD